MLEVNVLGAFNSVQWATRGMMNTSEEKPAPGGSIIVTVSLSGGESRHDVAMQSDRGTDALIRSAPGNRSVMCTEL
jgi:NAD(P)-dependent dehydrogenase (short-subunit alcohol dehydrogenase family)